MVGVFHIHKDIWASGGLAIDVQKLSISHTAGLQLRGPCADSAIGDGKLTILNGKTISVSNQALPLSEPSDELVFKLDLKLCQGREAR